MVDVLTSADMARRVDVLIRSVLIEGKVIPFKKNACTSPSCKGGLQPRGSRAGDYKCDSCGIQITKTAEVMQAMGYSYDKGGTGGLPTGGWVKNR